MVANGTSSTGVGQQKARILVVEDHPLFRERLIEVIHREGDLVVCGEADNVDEAMRLIRETRPDLVLLDITLKESNGLALVKALKSQGSGIPVLILSMHDEGIYAARSIRAGARGYITKDRTAADVIIGIRTVLSGDVFLSERATLDLARSLAGPVVPGGSRRMGRLTDRELEVLRLLGRGYTTREVAQSLKLGIASIDTYRARIKEKMSLRNAAELQSFATRWVTEQE